MAILSKISVFQLVITIAWCVLIIVNAVLASHAFRLYRHTTLAKSWPRISISPDSVELQRVVYTRDSSIGHQQNYEAIFHFHYQLAGKEYSKQLVKSVSSKEEAEQLKDTTQIELIYNPDRPDELLEKLPHNRTFLLMIFGIIIFNAFGIELIQLITRFVNEVA